MLPDNRHADDELWIKQQLEKLPIDVRLKVVERYNAEYSQKFDAEPVEHKKHGAARKHCNGKLREVVKRYSNSWL